MHAAQATQSRDNYSNDMNESKKTQHNFNSKIIWPFVALPINAAYLDSSRFLAMQRDQLSCTSCSSLHKQHNPATIIQMTWTKVRKHNIILIVKIIWPFVCQCSESSMHAVSVQRPWFSAPHCRRHRHRDVACSFIVWNSKAMYFFCGEKLRTPGVLFWIFKTVSNMDQ